MRWYNFARCILLFIVSSLAVNLLAADNESAKPAPAARQEGLPSAQEVLEKFAKELGGKEAFLKHQSQHAKGTIDMPAQQVKGTMEVFAARPDKLKVTMTMDGVGEFTTGYDGKVGWMNSQLTGPMLLSGKMLDEVATQADFDHTLHDPADYKVMEVLGREDFNGEDCYKLNLVHRTGYKSIEYFSTRTGLQKGFTATQETPLGPVSATTVVSDYKKFGDLLMPSKTIQKVSGMETVMTITDMEYDTVKPEIFQLPQQVKPLLEKRPSSAEKEPEADKEKKKP